MEVETTPGVTRRIQQLMERAPRNQAKTRSYRSRLQKRIDDDGVKKKLSFDVSIEKAPVIGFGAHDETV